ncbi:DNA polymerase III subunit delta [Moritella dasanensis]|uniref:DNA polymerase III subunit delta n=1 Tax=Moritella dasanensis TaxID=428031 RepID=UPI00031B18A7|nr:DNA polymerase III subunit delta [Moritella dasanensis]
MRVYPEQLDQYLKTEIKPCYLIFGEEPLLKMEAIEQIKAAAQKVGFDEHHKFHAEPIMDWPAVFNACQSMSLFSSRQTVELIFEKRPTKEDISQLNDLFKLLNPDLIIIISGPYLTKAQQSAKWFLQYFKNALFIPVGHPEGRFFANWMRHRLKRANLDAQADVITLLCRSFEGNLLAAKQEIDKLSLLHPGQTLTLAQLQAAITQHSHFSSFQLVDALLAGKVNRGQRILQQLQAEGVDPIVINWALNKEINQLYHYSLMQQQGLSVIDEMKKQRLWAGRQQIINACLSRLSLSKIEQMLILCSSVDSAIKTSSSIDPWLSLQMLSISFTDSTLLPNFHHADIN